MSGTFCCCHAVSQTGSCLSWLAGQGVSWAARVLLGLLGTQLSCECRILLSGPNGRVPTMQVGGGGQAPVQVVFSLWLLSYVLLPCWPKPVSWPRPGSPWVGSVKLSGKGGGSGEDGALGW